jgi:arylsulfatase A-like enzyme
MMIDWVSEYNNGTFHHYAEPEHATLAITREAKQVITSHVNDGKKSPLFLYVAYTAAHSPLQPRPQHIAKCTHIPHLWRRQFCGMVVGFDEGVKNITDHVKQILGENSIVVVTSDNGGSPWFGGMNAPLRGNTNKC